MILFLGSVSLLTSNYLFRLRLSAANLITIIRVFISPIFLLVYMEHNELGISSIVLPYILIFLLAVSEMSDVIDGYVARKYNQVTDLGKILDPMADSIARISVFLTFTQGIIHLPMLLVFVFLYRDSVVGTLRTICALRGFALAARSSGKAKAVVQAVVAFCIIVLMIPNSLGYISTLVLQRICSILVGMAGIYTVYSGFDYIFANRDYVKRLLTTSKRNING